MFFEQLGSNFLVCLVLFLKYELLLENYMVLHGIRVHDAKILGSMRKGMSA
jgi:hypothetical protein